MRWSTVAFPVIPPPWASVICTSFFILSLRILSYTLPTLLASVIPRSLLHFPFIPFPLYSLLISPSSQLSGIFSLLCISFIILQNIFLVSGSASMKISLGILSGPRLFLLLSFLIAPFSSWITIGSCSVPGFVYCCWVFLMVAVIILVDSSYSWVPGLAWYRFSKYVAMCSFVSSGFIISLPSSVMVLYSSSLFPLACLLACHMLLGSIFVLLISSLIIFSVCSASYFSIISLVLFCAFIYLLSVFSLLASSPPLHALSNSLFASFLSLFAALISSDCVFFILSVLIFTIPMVFSKVFFIILSASSYSIDPSSVCLSISCIFLLNSFHPFVLLIFHFLVKVFFLGLLIFMFVISVLWSVSFLLLPQTFTQ